MWSKSINFEVRSGGNSIKLWSGGKLTFTGFSQFLPRISQRCFEFNVLSRQWKVVTINIFENYSNRQNYSLAEEKNQETTKWKIDKKISLGTSSPSPAHRYVFFHVKNIAQQSKRKLKCFPCYFGRAKTFSRSNEEELVGCHCWSLKIFHDLIQTVQRVEKRKENVFILEGARVHCSSDSCAAAASRVRSRALAGHVCRKSEMCCILIRNPFCIIVIKVTN